MHRSSVDIKHNCTHKGCKLWYTTLEQLKDHQSVEHKCPHLNCTTWCKNSSAVKEHVRDKHNTTCEVMCQGEFQWLNLYLLWLILFCGRSTISDHSGHHHQSVQMSYLPNHRQYHLIHTKTLQRSHFRTSHSTIIQPLSSLQLHQGYRTAAGRNYGRCGYGTSKHGTR